MSNVNQCLYYITTILIYEYSASSYETRLHLSCDSQEVLRAITDSLLTVGLYSDYSEEKTLELTDFDEESILRFSLALTYEQQLSLVDYIILSYIDKRYRGLANAEFSGIQNRLLQTTLKDSFAERSRICDELIDIYYPTNEERNMLISKC